MRFGRSIELRERAHELIPEGAHTYAKDDDQYPEDAPGFIERGLGARVWDVDGNEFIEYGAGLRPWPSATATPRWQKRPFERCATAPTSCVPDRSRSRWRSSFSHSCQRPTW
jgi:hypothetical protein